MLFFEDNPIGELFIAIEKAGQITYQAIETLYIGTKNGAVLIWEAVSSCFGSGFWREELPWKDDDAWRDE